jgi:hypothetical protein
MIFSWGVLIKLHNDVLEDEINVHDLLKRIEKLERKIK